MKKIQVFFDYFNFIIKNYINFAPIYAQQLIVAHYVFENKSNL